MLRSRGLKMSFSGETEERYGIPFCSRSGVSYADRNMGNVRGTFSILSHHPLCPLLFLQTFVTFSGKIAETGL